MTLANEWARRFLSKVCQPGAELSVSFHGLGGYGVRVKPLDGVALSMRLGRVTGEVLESLRCSLDTVEEVTLLDRLFVASPIRLQFRNWEADLGVKAHEEVSSLLTRFRDADPAVDLLWIAGDAINMSLTRPQPADPERWRKPVHTVGRATAVAECPLCGPGPGIVRDCVPGADSCPRCHAVFVSRGP